MNEPQTLVRMLHARSIAVIGLSDDVHKPSHFVSAYMQRQGHRIIPINPTLEGKRVLGELVYGSLADVPEPPELVNVFRLPRFIPAIVDEMIALSLKDVWVQQGIVHLEAAAKAEAAGLGVVMDRCLMVESRLR